MTKLKGGTNDKITTEDADLVVADDMFTGDLDIEGEIDDVGAMDEDDIQGIVHGAVEAAIEFMSDEIAPQRIKAQRYMDGRVDIGHEQGRSSTVGTVCRDTVRAVKPSIQRVFMTSARPIEFIPTHQGAVASMEQASLYAAAKFRQADGVNILRSVTHDALVKKTGYTSCSWQEYDAPKVYEFEDLDDAQYQAVVESEGVIILSEESRDDEETIAAMREQIQQMQQMMQQQMQQAQQQPQVDEQGQPMPPPQMPELPQMPEELPQLHSMRIMRRNPAGRLFIEAFPPEEFFVDEDATSDTDFYVIGRRTAKRASDIVGMGIDADIVADLDYVEASSTADEEEETRRGYMKNRDNVDDSRDPSMELKTLTEAYMRMDIDGTGVPILHKFLLGGSKNVLLHYEPVDDHPIAGWHIDPEPHTYHGNSLVDILTGDQDGKTFVLRGIFDNIAAVNTPRTLAVQGQVNFDDLMNNEQGGIVRAAALDAVRELTVPFVAGQTLAVQQYLDEQTEVKSGVTRASMGLNADALQSTTKDAVNATINAAAGQTEVMVGNLAHTGMRRLFLQILTLMAKHATKAEMIKISGTYVPMDPRVWDQDLDAVANVGLGTGNHDQRNAVLTSVIQSQMDAIKTYGPDNPLAGLGELRNALGDLLILNGVHNVDRYYKAPPPPAPAGQQQPQQGQDGGDATAQALVQAEQIKAQVKMQSDAQKMQLEFMKANMLDDRERDRMTQDLDIAIAQIAAKYGMAVDGARIKAEQAATQAQTQMPQPQGGQQ